MKKNILTVLLALLATVVMIFVVIYGGGFLKRGTADFRGETKQIEQTKANSNYRIAQYEHFYNSCASVQSIESKIKNMSDELEETEDTQRRDILSASITASKNKRAELISKYNADTRKEGTMAQFKSSELPFSLNEEENTLCEIY